LGPALRPGLLGEGNLIVVSSGKALILSEDQARVGRVWGEKAEDRHDCRQGEERGRGKSVIHPIRALKGKLWQRPSDGKYCQGGGAGGVAEEWEKMGEGRVLRLGKGRKKGEGISDYPEKTEKTGIPRGGKDIPAGKRENVVVRRGVEKVKEFRMTTVRVQGGCGY